MLFDGKRKYIYVQPCPRCQSRKTGRIIFVSLANYEVEKIRAKKMKNGELVKTVGGFPDGSMPNLFCDECGAEWYGDYSVLRLTPEQIVEEQKARGITDQGIIGMLNYRKNNKKQFRINKKENRKKKKEAKNKFNKKITKNEKETKNKKSKKNKFKI